MKTGNFTVLMPPVPPVKSFTLQEPVQIGTDVYRWWKELLSVWSLLLSQLSVTFVILILPNNFLFDLHKQKNPGAKPQVI